MGQVKGRVFRIVCTMQTLLLCAMMISSCLATIVSGIEYLEKKQRTSNVSFEDTNWKIAAGCLSSKFGSQFVRNKDVKCASSQVVLSISRMQRARCKNCESYFHCEGFLNAVKNCKDNYDVQDTLSVMRDCQGLVDGSVSVVEATRDLMPEDNCQKYLCANSCMYNPTDMTCLRNNCFADQISNNQNKKLYFRYPKGRPLSNSALPSGSPIRDRIIRGESRGSYQGV